MNTHDKTTRGTDGMLSPYRVLDLTDDRGDLAGYLLAQLGANVIAVEPPEGQRSRRLGPFVHDRNDPEASLAHWAYNRGKRSVVLEGPEQLDALASDADILIECGAMPVDLARLRARNPALITVSISAFGQTGPKAGWAATDLTVCAASGVLALTGDEDRAPVRVGTSQTWRFAAADAACAALLALWERHGSGRGQHADISAQESYITATQHQTMAALVGKPAAQRIGGGLRVGSAVAQVVFPASNGHVTMGFLGGGLFGGYTARLFAWIHGEGLCDARWPEADWSGIGLLSEDPESVYLMQEGKHVIARFTATKTKEELLAGAMEKRLLIAPVMTTRDLLGLDHLAARAWWQDVDGIRFPGAFAKASVSPPGRLGRPARLGEHTSEVLAALPRSVGESRAAANRSTPPLHGITVLDFTWVFAGPGTTRILADHGATVIRVESQRRPDGARTGTPFIGEAGNQENSLFWHSLNAGKQSLTLDLGHPSARQVVLDLAARADIVVESFSPGTMGSMGIGYAALREVNDRLIMLSSSLMGQTGPMSKYAGYGMAGAAIAGFYALAGWPDRSPSGPFGAYSDYSAPRFGAAVLLGALEWRRRTGQGQYLDFSQLEGAAQLLGPEILDAAVNGRVITARGNEDSGMSPHGVYPVTGTDQWIAVACETDAHWRALAQLLRRDDLAGLDLAERLHRRKYLDELLREWTRAREGEEVEAALQALGVPSHRVLYAPDVVRDAQLEHRGHFQQVPHPIHGTSWAERSSIRLSRTPGFPRWAGPTIGQHLHEILSGMLAYDDEHIARLIAEGVLE
jgi:crotonobetainyl-CoA:carnitine CoA-transferase CaiB-like acyl-CoA transferase